MNTETYYESNSWRYLNLCLCCLHNYICNWAVEEEMIKISSRQQCPCLYKNVSLQLGCWRSVHQAGRIGLCVWCLSGVVFSVASLQTHTRPFFFWAEWGPPALPFFFYHRASFTSPLPLLVPKQQSLLVYLCVFALWFSSEQHYSSPPHPREEWLSDLLLFKQEKQRLPCT